MGYDMRTLNPAGTRVVWPLNGISVLLRRAGKMSAAGIGIIRSPYFVVPLLSLLRFNWAQLVAITGCESFEATTKQTNNRVVYAGNGWEVCFSHRTYHEVTGRAN